MIAAEARAREDQGRRAAAIGAGTSFSLGRTRRNNGGGVRRCSRNGPSRADEEATSSVGPGEFRAGDGGPDGPGGDLIFKAGDGGSAK